MKSLNKKLKQAGVVTALLAAKPSGQAYPQLSTRTLPNGIANSPTVQRVSGDVVLNGSEAWVGVGGEFTGDYIGFYRSNIVGYANAPNSIKSDDYTTLNYGSYSDREGIMVTNTGANIIVGVLKSKLSTLDVTGFRAYLSTNPISYRYQLATPIDTLNVPFTNPLIDLTKLGNNATLTNFAGTQTDGYTLEATVNSNGSPIEYTNLVPDPTFTDLSKWLITNGTKTVNNGVLTLTGNGGSTLLRFTRDLGVKPVAGTRLAERIRFRVNQAGASA